MKKAVFLALALIVAAPVGGQAAGLIDQSLDILGGNAQAPAIGTDTLGSGGGVAATGSQAPSQSTATSAMFGATGFANTATANSGLALPGVAANNNGVTGANTLGFTSVGGGGSLPSMVTTGSGVPQ